MPSATALPSAIESRRPTGYAPTHACTRLTATMTRTDTTMAPITSWGVCTPRKLRENATRTTTATHAANSQRCRRNRQPSDPKTDVAAVVWPLGKE